MNILMMASSDRIGLTYHLTELSLGLKQAGHNILVITSGGEQQKGLEELLGDAGIPVFVIPTIDSIMSRKKSDVVKLGRILDKERIDIIHANGLSHLFNAHCGKKLSNRKPALVMSVHSYSHGEPYAKPYLIAESVLLNLLADVVLPVSTVVSQELVKSGMCSTKINMVHNALNLKSFDKLLTKGDHLKIQYTVNEILGKPTVISMGSLVPRKGHVHLLKAIEYVKNEYPNIRCVVTGTGPLESRLKKLVSSLRIENNVLFTSYLRYEGLLQILKLADIAVVTSLSETFCHALIEPMAAEKPIVTTPVGVAPEIMKYNVGLLVPKKDPRALANAITWLFRHPESAQAMGS